MLARDSKLIALPEDQQFKPPSVYGQPHGGDYRDNVVCFYRALLLAMGETPPNREYMSALGRSALNVMMRFPETYPDCIMG